MIKVAKNYKHIYDMYNFDWDPEPGSVQYKIDARIARAQELRENSLARMAAGAEAELTAAAAEAARPALQLASVSGAGGGSGGGRAFGSGSAFASMSLGMPSLSFGLGRASKVMLNALTRAGSHVASHRRPRPSQMRKVPAQRQ